VKLSDGAFHTLESALRDGFSNKGEFQLVARCLNTRLDDVTGATRLQEIALDLIEWAESRDRVDNLIRCMKTRNSSNKLIAALDSGALATAPTTEEVVEAGAGASTFKTRLKEALGELDSPGLQIVAAQELSELLEGASAEEATTLYLALLGNLKLDRPDDIVSALVPVIAKCLRTLIGDVKRPDSLSLDLARTRLRRIDLSGLDLHEADIAFANLRHASLDRANLWRSRGYAVELTDAGLSRANLEEARWHAAVARETRFRDCRMVSIFLKEADLTGAEFQRSRLQGAHFERANLTSAHFEQANLADAVFTGATIDDDAADSIAQAKNWRQARFDSAAQELIEQKA
jgi:hypothetical protein